MVMMMYIDLRPSDIKTAKDAWIRSLAVVIKEYLTIYACCVLESLSGHPEQFSVSPLHGSVPQYGQ